MINFSFDSSATPIQKIPGQKGPSEPSYIVTSVLFNKDGREMICVFDNQEIRRFKFNEECNISQIESADVFRDFGIPINSIAAWNSDKIMHINQTGFTE